uniref:Deoxynucleoside kinase domain-containing protein n=1 Tax=Timema genevievae TaxID=629358 RepID=A0A7R9PIH7_TIMGE|nr:unnamed protein product [Timema genevievae]
MTEQLTSRETRKRHAGWVAVRYSVNKSWFTVFMKCPSSTIATATKTSTTDDVINNQKRPFRVSVEGNIGCGKSTLIRHFGQFPQVDSHLLWRNVQGQNLLDLLYQDINRWNFVFQNFVQLSRLNIQTRSTDKKVQMFERSLQNNRFCFVEMARKKKQLSEPEYTVLCEWYNWISNNIDIQLDLIVYLRSSPEIAHQRIQKRNRPEEMSISLDYLKDLHNSYESWLLYSDNVPAPVLQIDVNQELNIVQQLYQDNQHHILGLSRVDKLTCTP